MWILCDNNRRFILMHYLLKFVLFCLLLLQISCNCEEVDCGPYSLLKLKLLKDGQNAVFDPNPFISMDSISFSIDDHFVEPGIIAFNGITETINIYMDGGQKYVMDIKGIRTDTITGTFIVTGLAECGCNSYQLSKVTMNGQIICVDGCNDIIEVQL